jgi:uncharacterized membrane protein YsdA (DUF1294 family)
MSPRATINTAVIIGLGGGAFVVYSLWKQGLPPGGAYLVGIGIVTFLVYGFDKRQAKGQRTRVPENVLHIMALIGGTPGALLGQKLFHHKTQKQSFRRVFWAIVVLQIVAVAAVIYAQSR